MPFVTEELWQHLRPRAEGASIMRQELPPADRSLIDPAVEGQMGFVQRSIEAVRQIRSEMGLPPGKEITLAFRTGAGHSPETVRRYEGYLQRLARVGSLQFLDPGARPAHAASAVVDGEELYVPLEGIIDLAVERQRLQKEIDRIAAMAAAVRGKLENARFVERAPADVVAREREKLASFELTLAKLQKTLELL
ncbi:MAG TPA: class I tRNA ligase family protein, partial [Bacteroidota bacterium]